MQEAKRNNPLEGLRYREIKNSAAIIKITQHARERFCERFLNNEIPDEDERREQTDKMLMEMFDNAVYLSDNGDGVLFRNNEFNVEFIIRCRTIITVIEPRRRTKAAQHRLNLCDRKGIKP